MHAQDVSFDAPEIRLSDESIPSEVTEARRLLCRFVWHQARLRSVEVGFGWRAVPDAPGTPEQLLAAFAHSARTKEAFPVSSLFSDSTIYDRPETNYAFRFWHDGLHVELGLGFDLVSEALLGVAHLDVLRACGHDEQSIAFQLLMADTIGQARCIAEMGAFPVDQLRFALDCLRLGVDGGIEREAERTDRSHPNRASA